MGPVVLGTILNPELERSAASRPRTRPNDDDDDAGDGPTRPADLDYESLPDELTKFEPDKDFDKDN